MSQSCKTCVHWDRDEAKDKAGRIRSSRTATCHFVLPPLPDSYYDNWYSRKERSPRPMCATDGAECKTYEVLATETSRKVRGKK